MVSPSTQIGNPIDHRERTDVYAGLVDKFPLGAVMNKSLTLKGAQSGAEK